MNADLMEKVLEAYWQDTPPGTTAALERVVAVVLEHAKSEIANPSGGTIRPAMGERSEPASATGEQPVGAGSPKSPRLSKQEA